MKSNPKINSVPTRPRSPKFNATKKATGSTTATRLTLLLCLASLKRSYGSSLNTTTALWTKTKLLQMRAKRGLNLRKTVSSRWVGSGFVSVILTMPR